jgi:ABC-type transport system involved in cytochrome bd biosynthesis fused ATPase/permease subunit
MDGELYSYFFLLHDLGWGAVLFVLLSPPGFFTSLRGVTGVWHDGLLALVVMF